MRRAAGDPNNPWSTRRFMHKPEPTPQTDQHHQEDTVPDDNAMPQDLFPQLRLAILDRPDDDGLRTSTTSRSDLDIGEAFLRDRQQLLDHLTITHNDGPPHREADRASLNRWHWERHGSDLATFLHAHPVQV
jgi:hypothetical protein